MILNVFIATNVSHNHHFSNVFYYYVCVTLDMLFNLSVPPFPPL